MQSNLTALFVKFTQIAPCHPAASRSARMVGSQQESQTNLVDGVDGYVFQSTPVSNESSVTTPQPHSFYKQDNTNAPKRIAMFATFDERRKRPTLNLDDHDGHVKNRDLCFFLAKH